MLEVCWIINVFFFFFSSRRRHTRSKRDWSSDVCSSDLDGHICSLFAGEPGSADRGDGELVRHVAPPRHVEPKVARITLLPILVVTARMEIGRASCRERV